MAQVSVLGLGAMGSTLARVLLERGHEVTVWNRSDSERAAAVVAAGAARAATPAEAVSAAPLVLMCVTDYPAADEVLAAPGVLDALAGRTFVQLTNGNEDQVRAQLALVRAAGGRMLAGGILGYPRHIGRPETVIMYAGDAGRSTSTRRRWRTSPAAQRYLRRGPGTAERGLRRGVRLLLRRPGGLPGGGRAGRVARRRAGRVRRRHAGHDGAAARPHRRRRAAASRTGDYAGDQATVDVHLVGSERRRRHDGGRRPASRS